MKKLLLLITGLLLLFSVEGQILRYGNSTYTPPEDPSYPSVLDDANTLVWYDYASGVTKNNGTPDLVSQWDDLSDNSRHLVQATADYQPTYSASDGIILVDADDFMRTASAYSEPYPAQPFFIYMVMQQNTGWLDEAYIFSLSDGGAYIKQDGPTDNQIRAYAGATGLAKTTVSLNEWHIIRLLFDGADSKLIIDDGTPITGNAGAQAAIRIYLGDDDGASAITKYKEIIVRLTDGSDGEEAEIYNYLVEKYSLE